jgi:hypothetical protein
MKTPELETDAMARLAASGGSGTVEFRADDARIACPLFQAEYGGVTPTSALQLKIGKINVRHALKLNRQWHSRLPELVNWQMCEAYAAECGNAYFAVALWGQPVARMLNGRGWYELRRMAVAPDAPANTASRMLRVMRLMIVKARPDVTRLISYQDTEVHTGTIYKAAGWVVGNRSEGGEWSRPSRSRQRVVTGAEKVRWEYALRESPNTTI